MEKHKKNPVMHTGLIQLIYEHFKNMLALSNPITASTSEDYDTDNNMTEEKDNPKTEWKEEDPPSPKKSGKKTLLRKSLTKKDCYVKTLVGSA